MSVNIRISYGELVDKLTILMIKQNKIKDEEKLKHVYAESLSYCEEFTKTRRMYNDMNESEKRLKKQIAREKYGIEYIALNDLYDKLYQINLLLWQIEDEIREKEKKQEFDQDFIDTARLVYKTNDERFKCKSVINMILGSDINEQKEYTVDYNKQEHEERESHVNEENGENGALESKGGEIGK